MAVIRGVVDPALAWVCNRRGILVDSAPKADVQELRRHGDLPELGADA